MTRSATYERSVEIAAPAGDLYAFHLDTRNAPLISPPRMRFEEIAGEFPLTPGARARLTVRQPPLPFAQRWQIRIEDLQPGRLVVDVAERSPFAFWRHEHRFDDLGGGRSRLTDRVEFRLPLWPLSRVLVPLVRLALGRMFADRHRRTRALMEERRGAGAAPA